MMSTWHITEDIGFGYLVMWYQTSYSLNKQTSILALCGRKREENMSASHVPWL